MSNQLNHFALTDKGHYKSINEDAFKACPELGLWIVADGMGGHDGGDIASLLAVNCIATAVQAGKNLSAAIQQAHQEIHQLAITEGGKKGMATTVIAIQFTENKFEIAWVGDSRAYLFKQQQLSQLSHDHTVVQELIDKGDISAAQAKIHPQRHLITQALGGDKDINVERIEGELTEGILLLCSDGLSNELVDAKITSILSGSADLKEKSEKLIASVLALKGVDNITVLLLQKN
ncbi:MAG: serine/threonine-protein phosphatase [Methyloprofundus sp.]|nr:serine/threonine-protein phosphatase [Methyloprofundus sp.]